MRFYYVISPHDRPMLKAIGAYKVLLSYHYLKDDYRLDIPDWQGFDVFMDSGAFSAFTQGVVIDIKDYIKFIKRLIPSGRLKAYASLDVIGDAVGSQVNYQKMLDAGLKPLPVFHTGEDFKYLEAYCKSVDYLALGGMVGKDTTYLLKFLDTAFGIIKHHWPLKVHAFGIGTAMPLLTRYPFYSSDSSAWTATRKFGRVMEMSKEGKVKGRRTKYDQAWLKNTSPDQRAARGAKLMLGLEKHITDLWRHKEIAWK